MDIKFPRFSLAVPSPMFLIFMAWLVVHTEKKNFQLTEIVSVSLIFSEQKFFMTKNCLIEKLLNFFLFVHNQQRRERV